jgi:hypothetical protein
MTALPHRIRWIAYASAPVLFPGIELLIDGKVVFANRLEPYAFADDGRDEASRGNRAAAKGAIGVARGGRIYTESPVALTRTLVAAKHTLHAAGRLVRWRPDRRLGTSGRSYRNRPRSSPTRSGNGGSRLKTTLWDTTRFREPSAFIAVASRRALRRLTPLRPDGISGVRRP